jgi:murein DD-endopeptidase MepM/ murein hydrolase activator NlpD
MRAGEPVSDPVPDPSVRQLIAGHLHRSGNVETFTARDLSDSITDIQIETAISGASTLTVVLSDFDWSLMTDGWLDADADGYLQPVKIADFPSEGTSWGLCALDISSDTSQANLTLTFEDFIVTQLRDKWGPKKATRSATMTRAEFIQSLAKEVPEVRFVCPELRVVQPVAGAAARAAGHIADSVATSVSSVATRTSSTLGGPSWATNAGKAKGLSPAAKVTVKGVTANAQQRQNIQTALDVATQQKAPFLAVLAMVCAGTGESDFTDVVNSKGYGGVFQGQVNTGGHYFKATDTAREAYYFLKGGLGFQGGGAIHMANSGVTDPGQIATTVEGSGAAPNFYGQWAGEARKTIAAYGGFSGAGGSSSASAPDAASYTFQRGTTDDPDEDSWTCANRLAGEVNWSLFSNANALYYMDGADLIGQKPALHLDRVEHGDVIAHIEFTFDDTAFQSRTRTRNGKKKRPPRLQKANTPTEGKLSLVCGLDDYRAGDVFVLSGCGGAINGRWIVSDATRSAFNTYTEFTLSPPTAAQPEPAGTASAASKAAGSGGAVGNAPAGGKVGYPLAKRARLIGVPYQGTHARAFNQAGGSDNWQSENAVDLGIATGTPVLAVVDGTISPGGLGFGPGGSGRFAGDRLHLQGGGNTFFYTHLSRYAHGIAPGARVKQGAIIGYSGSANGVEHLHFAAEHGDPRDLIGQHS